MDWTSTKQGWMGLAQGHNAVTLVRLLGHEISVLSVYNVKSL